MNNTLSLSPYALEILHDSMNWMDLLYDPHIGLLRQPEDPDSTTVMVNRIRHMVRDSTYYALGLLMRGRTAEIERAERVLQAVLDYQLNEPGAVYHGTFLRYPQETRPTQGAREWRDYDPNWRDFIGTGFALILLHFEPLLSNSLVERIDASLRLAVEGTIERHVRPGYTNIALMDAYLLHYCGTRLRVEQWKQQGEALAQKVFDLFQQTGAFEEYNSPTYYGTDLYALRLWNSFSSSNLLKQHGELMESMLWEDIARYYHAGLGNVAGPWDRSYGLDMRRYAALLGLWIWLATGRDRAPFPNTNLPFGHSSDLCFGPCAAITGASIPEKALPHFLTFQGSRLVEQSISSDPRRSSSAWIDKGYMMGGEFTSRAKNGYDQFHPFTLHWQTTGNEVGWIRLRHTDPVDVLISPGQARIDGKGLLIFEVFSPGASPQDFRADHWDLNNLQVDVECDGVGFQVEPGERGRLLLSYHSTGSIQLKLNVSQAWTPALIAW